jgi:Cu-Zn family superoxide dismutase
MGHARSIAAALTFSIAAGFAAAHGQTPGQAPAAPAPPAGGPGRAGGGGPARGITINLNVIQKASAKVAGEKISGTVDFNEYQIANGGLIQIVYNLEGVPPGTHGVHVHTVGRCEPQAFASAGGHFDPGPAGNTDPDLNHPFHSGDLPNIVANTTGVVNTTSYTTRFNLGGPLSPFDADGAAIVIHQNPDTYQTGTKGQGVGGGDPIACGVIVK